MHLSLLVGIFCFALASSLTAILIKIAHKTHLLDRPIGRSAHSIPTPTGGGIALVLPFSLVLLFLHEIKLLGNEELTALSCGFLIALLGFADDIKPMDFRVRLPAQVGLGLVALVMLLPMAPLQIGKYAFSGEITLFILAFISLIWITNLYNFMDGIDGLAISELVFISGALVFFSAYEEDLKL
jgi:Fuc2NAc and GlcNAc transferase